MSDTAPDQMAAETPVFARTLDEWLDTHDNRPPGDVERGPTIVREVKTPLMDDVEQHGIGPWDDKRRKALGSAVVKPFRWVNASFVSIPRNLSERTAFQGVG